ncbi:MAG: hypothetical protein AB8H80_18740 [Planctomycetota bacterium]
METNHDSAAAGPARIPLPAKLLYTAFMAVLVPFYWHNYGPTNFLYFCDIALFLTLLGMWTERPLWLSMAAVGILLPQLFWVIDFASNLVGMPLAGMTDYMFDSANNPLFNRALSLFHGWLPFLLLWLVHRVGYDRRGFAAWIALAWALILVCYFWMPAPPADPGNPNLPVNINYVYGFGAEAQTWMPQPLYVALWMLLQPLLVVGPTHLLLRRVARTPRDGESRS